MNRSGSGGKHLSGPTNWILRYIKLPLPLFKAACATLDTNVHYGLMFSSNHTLVVSPSTTLSSLASNTTSQMHKLSSSLLVSSFRSTLHTVTYTKAFTSFTFVASLIPLYFYIVANPPIAAFPIVIILHNISLSHSPSLVIDAPTNM